MKTFTRLTRKISGIIVTILFMANFSFAQDQIQFEGLYSEGEGSAAWDNEKSCPKPLPTALPGMGEKQATFHKGMITIKLKEGLGEFAKQAGSVSFNIPSLDAKAKMYELSLLEKRFKYNPLKLRDNLPDLSRIYRITFPEKYTVNEVVRIFASDPNIEYAEPVPLNKQADEPDDELYGQCQHLPQIFAHEAWDIFHGEDGPETVIAIIDNGTYWKHVDLGANIWQNLGEDADGDGFTLIPVGSSYIFDPDDMNGIDDDMNGFTDDFIGWDMIANNNDPDHNSGEDHGTHTAGIAAGVTNNGTGISSISWNVKVMPVQVASPDGYFTAAYDGIIYAAENSADFISNSWGGSLYSLANQEVIDYVTGLGSIVVAAAHNYNNLVPIYPGAYSNVISVAALSVDDTKAAYSNYGPMVDISAPGGGWEGGILSTTPNNTYARLSGTSMACPMVAGCFGLLKSYRPDWTNEQLITQVMGTADNIDSLNPDYQYLLGTGRVNALNMLVEENVIMPQELKLELTGFTPQDENGNFVNEAGEEVTLNFEFRNYVPYVGEDNVMVTLLTGDPSVIILDGTATVNIPPEGQFAIEDQFRIQVGEGASSHFAQFTIHFQTNVSVVFGQDIIAELLVAPAGIFIFEGEEFGQDYSGSYFRAFLQHLGFDFTYSNTFPVSLMGFETVFLSQGNYGETLALGTMLTEENALSCQELLEGGGNLYIEMSGLFSGMNYYNYPNYTEMKQLFGVSNNPLPLGENRLDSLIGVEGSPFEGMLFTRSGQVHNWYIDKLEPAPGAIIPFFEYDYGNVSIMNDGSGSYGHKAFYFGYSLADLIDCRPTSSRNTILLKIMEFFGYELPEAYVLSNFISDKKVGDFPLEVQFSDISVSDPTYPINSWQWDFDGDGLIDSEEQNPGWTYNGGDSFDVMLVVSNGMHFDTLLQKDYITINHGLLVYEGVPDGTGNSGGFIREYLSENAYAVSYQNTFPESLDGFAAVFLSFGNFLDNYTELDDQMATTISDYLENGGCVYLEGGDALGFDQSGNNALLHLFGLDSADDGTENIITSLAGQPMAITADMLFNSSSQLTNSYIDIYGPLPGAMAAFTESDYGIVAVQNSGDFGQRTFCFSYALADLDDAAFPNTRAELLNRLCQFFEIVNPLAAFAADTTSVVEGDTIYFTDLSANNPTTWAWEFEGGTPKTSMEQNPAIEYALPGDYDVKLIVNNAFGSDTLLKTDFIHVDLAIGIETHNSPDFTLYPNPASDKLFISCKEKLQSVDIMNIAGEVVKIQGCNACQAEINMADLPSGMYFIRLQTINKLITNKIIKQ